MHSYTGTISQAQIKYKALHIESKISESVQTRKQSFTKIHESKKIPKLGQQKAERDL